MRIQVIEADDPRIFEHFIAPEQNPLNVQYVQQNYGMMNHMLSDVGLRYMEEDNAYFQQHRQYASSDIARSMMRNLGNIYNDDSIRALRTMEQIQLAKPIMQRYIMAEPYIRERFIEQTIDGYSDTYYDRDPGKIGQDHYDYRRATQAMIMEDEETGEWSATTYAETLYEGDRELTIEEKSDIADSMEMARAILYGGADPTDIFS